jgi:hypothetical protein
VVGGKRLRGTDKSSTFEEPTSIPTPALHPVMSVYPSVDQSSNYRHSMVKQRSAINAFLVASVLHPYGLGSWSAVGMDATCS